MANRLGSWCRNPLEQKIRFMVNRGCRRMVSYAAVELPSGRILWARDLNGFDYPGLRRVLEEEKKGE